MKLFRSINGCRPLLHQHSLQLGARFGTETDSLFHRLMAMSEPRGSVVPVLEKWVDEGKPVVRENLQWLVKQMRRYKRYSHSLQISMWMSDRRYIPLSSLDVSDRLFVIGKVHGIEQAEKYFNNLSQRLKLDPVYISLLNCYVEAKSLEKAEALFREMKGLKMLSPFLYNVMIKLYYLTENHDKVNNILVEMREEGISLNHHTYSSLMEAYASASNINGIEDLMRKINAEEVDVTWHFYATAAKVYSKEGLKDKALAAVRRAEELIPKKNSPLAYGFILGVYTDMGSKDEVQRIWNKYKLTKKGNENKTLMCMISCLLKLDDIEGAEGILREWESLTKFYDFRVPNMLIGAYCQKGILVKAEALVDKAMQNGRKPFANTWDRMAGAYFEAGQVLKGVEMMRRALLERSSLRTNWNPKSENISASMDFFRMEKDVEGAEEFVRLMRCVGPPTREVYNSLLRTYVVSGKPVSCVLDRMKDDGLDVDDETREILGSVKV